MLVKIDKKEKEAIEKVCVLSNLKHTFYNMENNSVMVQVEITEIDGSEISPKDAWLVGRTVVWTLATSLI